MLHRSFNRGMHRLIEKVQWPMYLINVSNTINCSCLDKGGNKANPACPHCLGTGKKIKIWDILAVKQPLKAKSRNGGVSDELDGVVNTYYIDAKYGPVAGGDIIVEEDEIDILQFAKQYRSDSGKVIYYECPSILKRHFKDIFLKNFYKIVGGYR